MESDHPFFFAPPQAHLMAAISHDNMSNEGDGGKFDLILENYDQYRDLVEFMLFDGGLANVDFGLSREAGNANHDLQGSPDLSLLEDDDALVSELGPWEEHRDDGDSSVVVTKTRRDRSKTLISERKRRGRMKDKLYELRSLVPNITKMDKASIIADAVVYVKDLQSQAKKLEEEISMLESSSKEDQVLQVSYSWKAAKVVEVEETAAVMGGKIMQVNAHEVGAGRFYVKVEGSVGDGGGAPSSLYSALQSLSCFDLESSNFSLNSEGFVFALTLKVGDFSKEMNATSMKLWVMGALLKEGFQLMQTTVL